MSESSSIDKRQARRAFSRAADNYDEVAVLQREIGGRMLERLDYVKLEPSVVLDAGCGTGVATEALARRYRKARVLALDFALPMLRRARRRGPWLRKPLCVCGDIEHLPLRTQTVDLVFSNAALQWSNDPGRVFGELLRVLKPGGLLMFTTFGPDTLKELRTAWSTVELSSSAFTASTRQRATRSGFEVILWFTRSRVTTPAHAARSLCTTGEFFRTARWDVSSPSTQNRARYSGSAIRSPNTRSKSRSGACRARRSCTGMS